MNKYEIYTTVPGKCKEQHQIKLIKLIGIIKLIEIIEIIE